MALKRPNLPSFASTDELSDVDITCSARTEPELISDAEDHALHSLLPLSSPNGDRIEMSADHEDCSTAGNSFSAACQLDLAVAAMTVHEGRDSLSADLLQDFTGSESSWKINENRSTDIESVDTVSARAPIESLHSPNSQTNTSRSPARTSCSRPYSLVEERAKRFGQKSSGSETRAINNGAVTLPTWKRPLGHSMMYDATTIHGTTAVSRHVVDDRPKAVFNPPEVDNSSTDRNSEELSWSKKTTSQAPPPAEIWSPPSVPMSAVDVLPGIFDEHTVLFEQSVRVEPSPERILGPVISQEEEIQTVSASASECQLCFVKLLMITTVKYR
jgi:hypothetical protein